MTMHDGLRHIHGAACLVIAAAGLSACTSSALRTSSVAVGSSVTEIQYQIVLDNIAMFRDARHTPDKILNILPWHAKITQGSISVTDTLSPSFSITAPNVSRTAQLSVTRAWSEAWTLVPEVDTVKLVRVRNLYVCIASDPQFERYFGEGPFGRETPSGRYGGTAVWVRQDQLTTLTNIALAVLDGAPMSTAERPGAGAAPAAFAATDAVPAALPVHNLGDCPGGGVLAALAGSYQNHHLFR